MRKSMGLILLCLLFTVFAGCRTDGKREPSFVQREGSKVFIVDRLGERWDVTEAEGIGFQPGGFQYGIGRNAFETLDDSFLAENSSGVPGWARVIGISQGTDAKAYSVARLSRHEISNSELDGKPVAVGY